MSNPNHQNQIEEIQQFITEHQISVQKNSEAVIAANLIPVDLTIGAKRYTVQVNDEYNDLAHNNELLTVVLVFRELAILNDSTDFLQWCSQNDVDGSNTQLLSYYTELCSRMGEITCLFPDNEIDYFITDLDFQLNAGAISILRK